MNDEQRRGINIASLEAYKLRNTYTQMSNVILDNLASFTPYEYIVLSYIVRNTIGYHRTSCTLTLAHFMSGRVRKDGSRMDTGTGLSKGGIRNALRSLEERGFIRTEKDETDRARITTTYHIVSYVDMLEALQSSEQNLLDADETAGNGWGTPDDPLEETDLQGYIENTPEVHQMYLQDLSEVHQVYPVHRKKKEEKEKKKKDSRGARVNPSISSDITKPIEQRGGDVEMVASPIEGLFYPKKNPYHRELFEIVAMYAFDVDVDPENGYKPIAVPAELRGRIGQVTATLYAHSLDCLDTCAYAMTPYVAEKFYMWLLRERQGYEVPRAIAKTKTALTDFFASSAFQELKKTAFLNDGVMPVERDWKPKPVEFADRALWLEFAYTPDELEDLEARGIDPYTYNPMEED